MQYSFCNNAIMQQSATRTVTQCNAPAFCCKPASSHRCNTDRRRASDCSWHLHLMYWIIQELIDAVLVKLLMVVNGHIRLLL